MSTQLNSPQCYLPMPACRPCLRPALRGCLALAAHGSAQDGKPGLSEEDAAAVATALLDVNVRSLVVADRQLCLELLRSLYQARHLSSLNPLYMVCNT